MTTDVPTRAEMNARLNATQSHTLAATKPLETRMGHFQQTVDQLLANIAELKRTVVITGVSCSLSTVLGIGAFNATVLSNMVASFDSGKTLGTDISAMRAEMRAERQELMADFKQEVAALRQDMAVIKGDILDIREQLGIMQHQLDNKVDRVPGKPMPRPSRPTRDLMPLLPR